MAGPEQRREISGRRGAFADGLWPLLVVAAVLATGGQFRDGDWWDLLALLAGLVTALYRLTRITEEPPAVKVAPGGES